MPNYKIDEELEELKKELDSYRPLPEETAKSLKGNLMLKYNQESNAIEGNSLTISETKVLLENGITAKGKPFKDHLDIINHQKAIEFLSDLLIWHNEALAKEMNPVTRAALLHTKFVRIHPFIDGNGRTARLLLNTELLKAGYPMAIIKKEDRAEYYDALESVGWLEDFSKIVAFIQENVKETAKFMLDIARQTSEDKLDLENRDNKNSIRRKTHRR